MNELMSLIVILLAPVALLQLWQLRWLWLLRRHDRVLHPICEIRSEMMGYVIREWEAGRLERDDYTRARLMLASMDTTVSMYRDHRTRIFNLRELFRFLARYRAAVRIIRVPPTNNRELKSFEQRLSDAMFRGFVAYTPWLASEIAGKLVLAAMRFLGKLGVKWVTQRLEATKDLFATVREQAESLGHGSGPHIRPA